jgi:GNAT superfamily N-acetyltransferase
MPAALTGTLATEGSGGWLLNLARRLPMAADTRAATLADWQTLGRIIGTAFAEDPVSRWALGAPGTILSVFTAAGRRIYLPRGICHLVETGGGTMWLPPNLSKVTSIANRLELVARIVSGSGFAHLGCWLKLQAAMQAAAPREPHFYLFTAGVLPAARGKGLARRLLALVLAEADARGLPCRLENSNPAHAGLYLSLGFEPVDTLHPPEGCPPMVAMRRAPQRLRAG